ncbi:hypothetical protein FUAX_16660 [Fulvitalea axinellae]|uniref:Rhodanese domain-containing protein n=1 Tax=Fulvitalea axinellae TaxID=1182444 RepID=A0AAU9CS25_9BACT|nr:hypothetical protein FUAX_16660 [Fulvitalea axinellae]
MKQKTIIVVGGLSAGPSAAAKARRMDENARIILFEKTSDISYATCGMPYALSGTIPSRDKLVVVKPELLEKRFRIDVRLEEPVLEIFPEEKKVKTNKGEYAYDSLVFATGSRGAVPPIPGLAEAKNWAHCRTMGDFDALKAKTDDASAKKVAVLGAGLIGVEVAENLKMVGKDVVVLEMAPEVLPAWSPAFGKFAGKVLDESGLVLKTSTKVTSLEVENGEICALVTESGERIECDFLVLATGGIPNTDILKNKGAECVGNGALVVDENMRTSLPGIFAAGDCAVIKHLITKKPAYFPLGTHSNKGGRTAGANATGANERFKGAYGTAIVKLFGHTLARTGMNGAMLDAEGVPYKSTFVIGDATPGYYPGQKPVFLKIWYHADDRRLLGAEAFGEKGIDKRIDVLSVGIYAKLTIDDLPQLDLAYAPPFSPAKDPVVVAGYVAGNASDLGFTEIHPEEFETEKPDDAVVLDVRNPKELEATGKIFGAVNIPLDQLRDRLDELDKSKPVFVYCAKGLRGYLGALVLSHNGFEKVYNISGGMTHWKMQGMETV